MRCNTLFPLLSLLGAIGCGSDSATGSPGFAYTLQPAAATVAIGQDSTVALGVTVTRGTDVITGARLSYSSGDYRVATVDSIGRVTGLAGGSTTITVRLGASTLAVPVTVRARPATLVDLTVLSGPAGGLKSVSADTGTFYALPADPATSRLRAVVMAGADTVFCNYCVTKTPARVQRLVRFVSLDTALARVSNANNPLLQTSTDTSGRVTPRDTSATGVRIVMEVPGDSTATGKWKDTVLVKLSLRPLDSLRIRPDSNMFPTANGTGLQKQPYPFSDSVQANIAAAGSTNFIAGLDFLSRVQDLPNPATPGTPGGVRYIVARVTSPDGDPLVRRPSLPNVFWESANASYLSVNAAGAVTGRCSFIGGDCPTPPTGSWILNCTDTGGRMPATFGGLGTYSIPSCSPAVSIPRPGAFCTSNVATDISSTCTIYIRATAFDPVSGKQLRALYRINIRR